MQNLLDMRPVRLRGYKLNEGGDEKFTVLIPKFGNSFIGRFFKKWSKFPFYKVKLDEFGSFVWHRCDGEKPVKFIANDLKEKFGEKVEPVNDRLALFLKQMEKAKMIGFKETATTNLIATSLQT